MTLDFGSCEATVNGQTQRWDSVKLLDSGVLRVAQLDTWRDQESGVMCTAEKAIEYLAPGTWTNVTPDPAVTGTLIFFTEKFTNRPQALGTGLTESEAESAAAAFLAGNYAAEPGHLSHISNFFREHSCEMARAGALGQYDVPQFRWITRPTQAQDAEPDTVSH